MTGEEAEEAAFFLQNPDAVLDHLRIVCRAEPVYNMLYHV